MPAVGPERNEMVTLTATYFGPVAYYKELVRHKEVTLSRSEPWQKQTVRNRAVIMTANGPQTLTVPVTVPSRTLGGRPVIKDVRVADNGNWRHLHWQALASAYGQSPFFDFYADEVRPLYEKRYEWLTDYDLACTLLMMQLLGIGTHVSLTDDAVTLPVERIATDATPYYQTFQRRHGFVMGMSVLDLLFNMGPEAVLVLSHTMPSDNGRWPSNDK